jgi:ATP-dependent Clp protease ATP-binding subunit ClpA
LWCTQVILDEFEKLHPEAMLGFLEPWDTGKWVDTSTRATDAEQTRQVDCVNTIFILVTNVALPQGDVSSKLKAQLPFPMEVNGRITGVFPFARCLPRLLIELS